MNFQTQQAAKPPVRKRRKARELRRLPLRSAILPAGLLFALALVTYAPLWQGDYIWDDDFYVTENSTLRSADGLRRIWFELGAVPQYYPLVHSTFWIEYHLWKLAPLGYHLVNLALHAGSAVLAWRLLVRLRVPGAWLAAAIFTVHPVEVESVAWITERKNVLSLTLALASMLCYLRFAPPEDDATGPASGDSQPGSSTQTAARLSWYAAALLLFAAALFSKTVVATLPAALLVIYWWQRGRITWRDVVPLVPFFALGIGLGQVTVWMEEHVVKASGKEWDFTLADRVLIAGRAAWFYAAKLFWPHPLMFFYPRWEIDDHMWWQYAYPAAAVGLVLALWLARKCIGRAPLAAALIFGGVLVPALGFVNVYPMRFSYVADHFQYHASLALVALAAAGATMVFDRLRADQRSIAKIGAAGALVVLAAITCQRTTVYRNVEVLFHETIAQNPLAICAYANLVHYRLTVGRYDDAYQSAQDALRVFPEHPDILLKMGACLVALAKRDGFAGGQLEEAVAYFQKALEISPDMQVVHYNLGKVMVMAQRPEEATKHFQRALELTPDDEHALCGMGDVQAATGKWRDAQYWFQEALRHNPESADAHYGLAVSLANQQQFDAALRHFESVIALNPAHVDARVGLGDMLLARNQLRLAAEQYIQAVKMQPNSVEALHNLGLAFTGLGNFEQAIVVLRKAQQLRPDDPRITASLGRALGAIQSRRAR